MSKLTSTVGKTLLKNIIRHTDTHNRLLEESEMWRQRRRPRPRSPRRVRSTCSSVPRAHMDRREDTQSQQYLGREDPAESTYWMRQLCKAEEQDSERWGHGGYKELYPDDFNSDRSDTDQVDRKKHRKRAKRKHSKKETKRKHKKSEKDLGKKHHRSSTKRKHDDPSEDASNSKRHRKKSSKKSRLHRDHNGVSALVEKPSQKRHSGRDSGQNGPTENLRGNNSESDADSRPVAVSRNSLHLRSDANDHSSRTRHNYGGAQSNYRKRKTELTSESDSEDLQRKRTYRGRDSDSKRRRRSSTSSSSSD